MAHLKPVERPDEDVDIDIDFLLGTRGDENRDQQIFRIGDLSKEFGVTLRTLRFYEDRGLLLPERRGTTRLYSRRDRKRLRLILLAKTLGFSLTEAKQLIELYDQPNGRTIQLQTALDRFEEQQDILDDQKREIENSIKAMDLTISLVREKLKARADA